MDINLTMLNMLINAFATAGRHMEALSIYHELKESVSFNSILHLMALHKQSIS